MTVFLVQGEIQPLLSHLKVKHKVLHHSSLLASLHFFTNEEQNNIIGTAEPRIVKLKEDNEKLVDITDELYSMTVMAEVKNPDTKDKIKIKMPKSRMNRDYHGMTVVEKNHLEKEIESGQDHFGKDLNEKEIERKIVQLTYLKNSTGSFAGPYDRPMHLPIQLGKSLITFDEYTNFTHEPKEEHYKFEVDYTFGTILLQLKL